MRRYFVTGIGLIALLFASCKKENEEDLIKQNGSVLCDTADMKYSVNILPVIQSNCYSCHGNGLSEGGISLNSYSDIKIQVENKRLINAITHAPGYSPMPQGLPKLSACDINKISAWINRGAPDN